MKKMTIFSIALLLTLAVSGCGSDDSQLKEIHSRGVLRVGIKVDVPGFGYLNPDTKKLEGLEIDLIKMIAQELLGNSEAVELTGVTAQTRGPMLDNGEIDLVIATFTITEERKKLFNFTEPYFYDEIGLLVRKDAGLKGIMDMQRKTVGVAISGTAYGAILVESEKRGLQMNFRRYASYPEIKAALLAGEIDAFAVDKSILSGYTDDSTIILKEGFSPQDYGIATRLDNKQLATFLDRFIKNLKKDGRLEEILTRWGQTL
jgi:putative glutamine transport system substrate-binding protein